MTAPPSPVHDDDLDAELEAVFDAPHHAHRCASPPRPASLPPLVVPPSPERKAPKAKRSILDALLANADRLSRSSPAFKLAADLKRTVAAAAHHSVPPTAAHPSSPTQDEQQQQTRAQPPPSAKQLMQKRINDRNPVKRKASSTRNAMQVVSAANQSAQNTAQLHTYEDREISNLSLRNSPYTKHALHALFERNTRVDIAELPLKSEHIRMGQISQPIVFAVLVAKHKKRQARGNAGMYAVWSVYNMPRFPRPNAPPSSVLLLLFGNAFESWHTAVPGTAFALRRPTVLPPRAAAEQNVSGVCLKVSKDTQMVYLGVARDFAVCDGLVRTGAPCGAWFDANRMRMCVKHSRIKLKQLTSSKRMDVNNALRPTPKRKTPTEETKLSVVMHEKPDNKEAQMDRSRIKRLKRSRHKPQTASAAVNKRREEYVTAVQTLTRLGFALDPCGSLMAPSEERALEYGPLYKQQRTQTGAADTGITRDTAQLTKTSTLVMELSDESDSDDDS